MKEAIGVALVMVGLLLAFWLVLGFLLTKIRGKGNKAGMSSVRPVDVVPLVPWTLPEPKKRVEVVISDPVANLRLRKLWDDVTVAQSKSKGRWAMTKFWEAVVVAAPAVKEWPAQVEGQVRTDGPFRLVVFYEE